MNKQKDHWDNIHKEGNIDHFSEVSSFAEEVLKSIESSSYILEIGCGAGNDSIAFASARHKTLSTDFSEVAIDKDKKRFAAVKNLEFDILDISELTQFTEGRFDVIYARLSLHYFNDVTTKKIFVEINRILKPNGILAFICKSVDDPLYGKGKELEKDMLEYKGHIRHFF